MGGKRSHTTPPHPQCCPIASEGNECMNRHLRESPKSLDKSTPRTLELDQEALSPIPINQMGHRKAHDATVHTLHSVQSVRSTKVFVVSKARPWVHVTREVISRRYSRRRSPGQTPPLAQPAQAGKHPFKRQNAHHVYTHDHITQHPRLQRLCARPQGHQAPQAGADRVAHGEAQHAGPS